MRNKDENWDTVIRPKKGWFEIDWISLWKYRDLIFMLVKRDLAVTYKQTILGPLWFLLQPLISTATFTVIFGKIAKLPTDGVPPFLFYLAGMTAWGYFASCVSETSNTFNQNAGIFSKVYFPRMTVPISVVISNLARFAIQFMMFLLVYAIVAQSNAHVRPGSGIFMVPLLIVQMGILGLGVGMLVSSLVTKYRDLSLLLQFGIQLWMYACPIIYPTSQIPVEYRKLYMLNPMASVIENFKAAFLGTSTAGFDYLAMSWATTLLVFALGLLAFNRVEKSFVDVV